MEQKILYVAQDGKEFKDEMECLEYEAHLEEAIKQEILKDLSHSLWAQMRDTYKKEFFPKLGWYDFINVMKEALLNESNRWMQ